MASIGRPPERPRLRVPDTMPWAPSWQRIVDALRAAVPDLRAVVLYGSRAWGGAEAGSDYDVLAVVEDRQRLRSRRLLRQQVSATAHLIVDLNLATPAGLRLHALLDPYIAFTLKAGVRVGDLDPPLGPLSRQGIEDALACVGLDIEDALETLASGSPPATLTHIAKSLAVLAAAAQDQYTPGAYRERLAELLTPTATDTIARMGALTSALRVHVGGMASNAGDVALREYVAAERSRVREQTV